MTKITFELLDQQMVYTKQLTNMLAPPVSTDRDQQSEASQSGSLHTLPEAPQSSALHTLPETSVHEDVAHYNLEHTAAEAWLDTQAIAAEHTDALAKFLPPPSTVVNIPSWSSERMTSKGKGKRNHG